MHRKITGSKSLVRAYSSTIFDLNMSYQSVLVLAGAQILHVGFGTATQWGILVEHWGVAAIWTATPWESALGPFTSGLSVSVPPTCPFVLTESL